MIDAKIAEVFVLDPSITRGLDYYTGVVYETFLNDLPSIGSVCSGGRYDNLANLYTKERLSGVGASIGLDRLIAALEMLNRSKRIPSFANVAIACLDESLTGKYQLLALRLRKEGIACEVFTENKKPVQQYTLAEKKGARWIILANSTDLDTDRYTIRELSSRTNHENMNFAQTLKLIKDFS